MYKLRINICLIVLLLIICFVSCSRTVPAPSEQQREVYRKEVAPIVAWLEGENNERGIYPPSLPVELQANLDGLDAPAKYNAYSDGTAYSICVGDYRRYEWEYAYDSHSKGWVFDM